MRTKYELSLWRDIPAETSITEEKVRIISSDTMPGDEKAYNLVFQEEYTGQLTLTFNLPVHCTTFEGEIVENDLIRLIQPKSKLKLFIDEKWYNQFARKEGGQYVGEWQQGRWFDFVVSQRKEVRQKKQLVYQYTCESLFVSELSHSGYNLEFVSDTDIMSASGMGTAHTLAERVLDGTDWTYVKTETFPDYKEEFNPETGETEKIPVATDQIDFAKGLERYMYCNKLECTNEGKQGKILNKIKADLGLTDISEWCGFENNVFWWKRNPTDTTKEYVYSYNNYKSNTNFAKAILVQDDGEQSYQGEGEGSSSISTAAASLSSTNLWGEVGSQIPIAATSYWDGIDAKSKYYLELKQDKKYYNMAANNTPFEIGDLYVFNIQGQGLFDTLEIYDTNNPSLIGSANLAVKYGIPNISLGGSSFFAGSVWIQIPVRIQNPVLVFSSRSNVNLTGIYFYEFKGATKELDDHIRTKINNSSVYIGNMGTFETVEPGNPSATDWDKNRYDNHYLYLPFNQVSQNKDYSGAEVYLCEFEKDGNYIDSYIDTKNTPITKITSEETDKRRAINVSKSNRYSILEQICKTFYCFNKFVVDHDSTGHITRDGNGKLKKYVTFTTNLGGTSWGGFTYGTNLVQISRNSDATNLVTKMYVENIDNEYDDNGVISIQNAVQNSLKENFIYNFSYFMKYDGLLDRETFKRQLQALYDQVGQKNTLIQGYNLDYLKWSTIYQEQSNLAYTYDLIMKSFQTEANKLMSALKWSSIEKVVKNLGTFPDINLSGATDSTETIPLYSQIQTSWDGTETLDSFGNVYTFAVYLSQHMMIEGSRLLYGGGYETIKNQVESLFTCQEQYKIYRDRLGNAESGAKTIADYAQKQMAEADNHITSKVKEKQAIINQFENQYAQYIIEGVWSGNDYIEPDTYYLDACRTMSTSCVPKVEYSMDVIDLSKLVNPYDVNNTTWGEDFVVRVGDTTTVTDVELFGQTAQKAMVASIEKYLDKPQPDKIVLQNYETRFEDLFQSIAAAVTQVYLNENIYSRAENFDPNGSISTSSLQKAFSKNSNLVMASANNQVVTDNNGLTITSASDPGKILKAIASGIFLSNTNGETYTAAITADGINASMITTGELDVGKIAIRPNGDEEYVLDSLGLTGFRTQRGNNEAPNKYTLLRHDKYGVYLTDKVANFTKGWDQLSDPENFIYENSIFSLTSKGVCIRKGTDARDILFSYDTDSQKLTVVGDMSVSSGGTVGEWHVNEKGDLVKDNDNSIYLSPTGQTKKIDGQYITHVVFSAGETFAVTKEGNLYAKGTIKATRGEIGGFIISPDHGFYYEKPKADSSGATVKVLEFNPQFSYGTGETKSVIKIRDTNGNATVCIGEFRNNQTGVNGINSGILIYGGGLVMYKNPDNEQGDNEKTFWTDTNGNLNIKGEITGGYIGGQSGWAIRNKYIEMISEGKSVYLGDWTDGTRKNFLTCVNNTNGKYCNINQECELWCEGAHIKGEITATSGTFTGTVNASTINSSTINASIIEAGIIKTGSVIRYDNSDIMHFEYNNSLPAITGNDHLLLFPSNNFSRSQSSLHLSGGSVGISVGTLGTFTVSLPGDKVFGINENGVYVRTGTNPLVYIHSWPQS